MRGEPTTAQVLPGEDQAVAGRQAITARTTECRPERPRNLCGKPAKREHNILPARHPTAKSKVEVFDPTREVERVIAAEGQESLAIHGQNRPDAAVRSA